MRDTFLCASHFCTGALLLEVYSEARTVTSEYTQYQYVCPPKKINIFRVVLQERLTQFVLQNECLTPVCVQMPS